MDGWRRDKADYGTRDSWIFFSQEEEHKRLDQEEEQSRLDEEAFQQFLKEEKMCKILEHERARQEAIEEATEEADFLRDYGLNVDYTMFIDKKWLS